MGYRGLLACGGRPLWSENHREELRWKRCQRTRNAETDPGQLAAVDRTIDLFNHGTVRGGADPNPLEAVSLPSTLVHLHLILPRFSDPGSYVVAVSKDRAGTAIVARGTAKTHGDGQRLLLDVPLDLRAAKPGSYFLATVRESDNGTYYYPLNVQGR